MFPQVELNQPTIAQLLISLENLGQQIQKNFPQYQEKFEFIQKCFSKEKTLKLYYLTFDKEIQELQKIVDKEIESSKNIYILRAFYKSKNQQQSLNDFINDLYHKYQCLYNIQYNIQDEKQQVGIIIQIKKKKQIQQSIQLKLNTSQIQYGEFGLLILKEHILQNIQQSNLHKKLEIMDLLNQYFQYEVFCEFKVEKYTQEVFLNINKNYPINNIHLQKGLSIQINDHQQLTIEQCQEITAEKELCCEFDLNQEHDQKLNEQFTVNTDKQYKLILINKILFEEDNSQNQYNQEKIEIYLDKLHKRKFDLSEYLIGINAKLYYNEDGIYLHFKNSKEQFYKQNEIKIKNNHNKPSFINNGTFGLNLISPIDKNFCIKIQIPYLCGESSVFFIAQEI